MGDMIEERKQIEVENFMKSPVFKIAAEFNQYGGMNIGLSLVDFIENEANKLIKEKQKIIEDKKSELFDNDELFDDE